MSLSLPSLVFMICQLISWSWILHYWNLLMTPPLSYEISDIPQTDRKRHCSWHSMNRRQFPPIFCSAFPFGLSRFLAFVCLLSIGLLNIQRGPSADLQDSSSVRFSLLLCPVISLCLGFTRISAPSLSPGRLKDSTSASSPWVRAGKLPHNREMAHLQSLHHLFLVYWGTLSSLPVLKISI